jgi:hypothetical protein
MAISIISFAVLVAAAASQGITSLTSVSKGSNQPSINAECKIVAEAYALLGGSEEFGAPPSAVRPKLTIGLL